MFQNNKKNIKIQEERSQQQKTDKTTKEINCTVHASPFIFYNETNKQTSKHEQTDCRAVAAEFSIDSRSCPTKFLQKCSNVLPLLINYMVFDLFIIAKFFRQKLERSGLAPILNKRARSSNGFLKFNTSTDSVSLSVERLTRN